MTKEEAKRKCDALRRMTVARGCTPHEAETARRLADQLAKKFGFASSAPQDTYRPDFDSRFHRAENRAASRFSWEYRKCGKPNCHCARASSPSHGPYKYRKERDGKTVRSVYIGK